MKTKTHKDWLKTFKALHKYCVLSLDDFGYRLKKKNMQISKKDLNIMKLNADYCIPSLVKAVKESYDEIHLKRFISEHKDLLVYFI